MTHQDVIRAWKDADFRNSLTAEQLAALPENPAGLIALDDADLDVVAGGAPYTYYCNTSEGACATWASICTYTYNC